MKRISVVYSYQPNDQLLCTADELIHYGMEVVVVDDGSGEAYDNLFTKLQDHGAEVIRLPLFRGKAAALKEGICFVLERENDECTLVTLDGNQANETRDIFRVCIEAELHPEAIALGCHSLEKEARFVSRMGHALTRLVYRLCSGIAVMDIQPALCAFSAQTATSIVSLDDAQSEYERNVLMAAARQRIPLHQLSIEADNSARDDGQRRVTLSGYVQIMKQILMQRSQLRLGKTAT